jgi:hypothetical protein
MDTVKEKEMCKALIHEINNEGNTIEITTQLLNKYLTSEGQSFISKMTKGREEVRNALLDKIENLEKCIASQGIESSQENTEFIKASVILKDKLKEINRIYYNSIEFMSYLMLSKTA